VPVTALAKRLRPILAMTLGFGAASLSWFIMGTFPTLGITILAIAVFAVGEATQAPRYYEYVADLAPKEQVGTYMGFAFLPVAIGTFFAGALAAWLLTNYMQGWGPDADPLLRSPDPQRMWYVVGSIGLVSTALMVLYDRFIAPKR
jgi:proton-dependent oligopeptide transporter, POT family